MKLRSALLVSFACTSLPACYFEVATRAPTRDSKAPAHASTATAAPTVPAFGSAGVAPPSPASSAAASRSSPATPNLGLQLGALLRRPIRTRGAPIAGAGGGTAAATCSVDAGPPVQPPPCSVPAGACATSDLAARRCRAYSSWMVPVVADAAVRCLDGLTGPALCDASKIDACTHAALAKACPDPETVGQFCDIASTSCRSSREDCVTLLSALTADGQDAVARCVGDGCSGGLSACVDGLGARR